MNGQNQEVVLCVDTKCSLYLLRFGKKPEEKNINTLSAIKKYCKDCVGEGLPSSCDLKTCKLFVFRSGKNPRRRGVGRKDGLWSKNPL